MIAALWTPSTDLGRVFLGGLDLGDDKATRARCERMSRELPEPIVIRGENGAPYLTRWTIEDYGYSRRVFLHLFSQSDRATHRHNHPWRCAESVVLAGRYRDERAGEIRELGPGEHNVIGADDYHRVEILDAQVWTLFVVGQVVQSWEFEHVDTGARTPWRRLVTT